MLALMGASSKGDACLQGLSNTVSYGDLQEPADKINDFFISVSSDLLCLNETHPVFQLTDQQSLPSVSNKEGS